MTDNTCRRDACQNPSRPGTLCMECAPESYDRLEWDSEPFRGWSA